MKLKTAMVTVAATLSFNAFADDHYVMSCDDIVGQLNREATPEAQTRFADLRGSCMGVVDRDGALYMHTKMVVRRVRGNTVTLYLPATDSTVEVSPDSDSRVEIAGRKVRPRDLARGQELNLYVSVDAFTQPVIEEIHFENESGELVGSEATQTMALPTTG